MLLATAPLVEAGAGRSRWDEYNEETSSPGAAAGSQHHPASPRAAAASRHAAAAAAAASPTESSAWAPKRAKPTVGFKTRAASRPSDASGHDHAQPSRGQQQQRQQHDASAGWSDGSSEDVRESRSPPDVTIIPAAEDAQTSWDGRGAGATAAQQSAWAPLRRGAMGSAKTQPAAVPAHLSMASQRHPFLSAPQPSGRADPKVGGADPLLPSPVGRRAAPPSSPCPAPGAGAWGPQGRAGGQGAWGRLAAPHRATWADVRGQQRRLPGGKASRGSQLWRAPSSASRHLAGPAGAFRLGTRDTSE